MIGDLHTVALVGMDGSIDFMCFPHFDSPTIFAGLLDHGRGGSYRIAPSLAGARQKQLYLPDSNILLSRFLSDEGVAEITDFMTIAEGEHSHDLVRQVGTVRGEVGFRVLCDPRFDYGRRGHRVERFDGGVLFVPEGKGIPALRFRSRIWEVRGKPQEFLYSRLMCGVAVDRAIRLASKRSFPAPLDRWHTVRDTIYRDIFEGFWDPRRQAFVQSRGGRRLDAANLLMPLVKFVGPTDPRWLSTLRAMEQELVEDSHVYRYRTFGAEGDGLSGEEGTFTMCSFWYVEFLSRAGELGKARFFIEKMLGYANHLGLYSEELGPLGEHLGNYPQDFTHLGLISAAHNLDRNLSREGR